MRAQAAPAQNAAVAVRERPLDLLAGERTALARVRQRGARVEERLLDARDREVEHVPDLRMAEPVELAQQERRALALGKVLEIEAQQPQFLALGHAINQVAGSRRLIVEAGRDAAP